MALPPELFDKIIDFLHDDYFALKASSLVCRSWVKSSRYHLFRHVAFGGNGDRMPSTGLVGAPLGNCRRLYSVILKSPDIARYVTNLIIFEGPLDDFHCIRNLLKGLTSLQTLSLYNNAVSLTHGLISIIASLPSVHELHLRDILILNSADLLHVFQSWKHLTHLHLTGLVLSIDQSSLEWPTVQSLEEKRAAVEVLTLDNSILAFLFLLPQSPIDISRIRHLTLLMQRGTYIALANLLPAASSLKRLEVELIGDRKHIPVYTLAII